MPGIVGTASNAPVGICFMPVADPKKVKNRVHLDRTSTTADRSGHAGRYRADRAESWAFLAGPEGDEFCVVLPEETLTR